MLQKLSFKQANEAVVKLLRADLVPYLCSAPGLGKSSIAQRVAKEFNLLLIDIRVAQEDPTCINGYPTIIDGRSAYAPPKRFPLEGDPLPINPETNKPYSGWLIFFDELSSAPRATMAACYKILLDRMIGERKIHPLVRMMAAGNGTEDDAIANPMGTALKSRVIHLHLESQPKDWLDYAAQAGFDSRICSYLGYQKNNLNTFKKFSGSSDETFACERTWEFVSKYLKANYKDQTKPIPQEDAVVLAGTIGSIAYEFVTYTESFKDLPTLDQVIANPAGCDVPSVPAVRWLMTGMLASSTDMQNADQICKYVERMTGEFRMLFIKMLWGRSDKFLDNDAVNKLTNTVANILY